ncbi:MAG: hypothetical protein ABSA46_19530 [Thermodesulfovibrionales bacterium]
MLVEEKHCCRASCGELASGVVRVRDGEEALADPNGHGSFAARKVGGPPLVPLDLELPERSGLEVFELLCGFRLSSGKEWRVREKRPFLFLMARLEFPPRLRGSTTCTMQQTPRAERRLPYSTPVLFLSVSQPFR